MTDGKMSGKKAFSRLAYFRICGIITRYHAIEGGIHMKERNHFHHGQHKSAQVEKGEAYKMAEIDERLLWNLGDAGHVIYHRSEERSSQKRILILLSKTGVITQRELTERLRVQSASSSEILTKMEQSGWICRTENGKDRRTMDVALTPEGEREAAAAEEQIKAAHREMFACLEEEEKESLLVILEKLNREWDIRYRGTAGRPEGASEQCRKRGTGRDAGSLK